MKNSNSLWVLMVFGLLASCSSAREEQLSKNDEPVWQWSVTLDSVISSETKDHPNAYLWVPEDCEQVKGVVLTQNNMIEEGMLEHPVFRNAMRDLGLAEVWIDPNFTINFDFHTNTPEVFQEMMQKLADESGYAELATAPIIPLGHSALATYPWNFAAWDPDRTLALISIHGDAPQTTLTGYGRANVDWGDRNIDGVPALFVMGEYEWWEDRITPAYDYIQKHPNSVITLFADAGHGHFDYSDALIDYVCLYLRKVVENRLGEASALKSIAPETGWLMDKWRKDSLPQRPAATYEDFGGDRLTASWVFDQEQAEATEAYYAKARAKKQQFLGITQDDQILEPGTSHANYHLTFNPLADGKSFRLQAFFTDSTRIVPASDHAQSPLSIDRITGPVSKVDDSTFQVHFGKLGFGSPKRSNDIWLLAHNEGDAVYKSVVQQLEIRFPLFNKEGRPQTITFPDIEDQTRDVKHIPLAAASDAGLPVEYYVKVGPAYIAGDQLIFTAIPPKAKYPIKVTVVAWQYGVAGVLQSAQPVEQGFLIVE